MEIEIEKKEQVVKKISLPYFFKLDFGKSAIHYAIFEEDKAMSVAPNSINCYHSKSIIKNIGDPEFKESTESEFTEAFEKTAELLTQMLPEKV